MQHPSGYVQLLSGIHGIPNLTQMTREIFNGIPLDSVA